MTELVIGIRAGEEQALAALYRALYPSLWRLAVRLVSSSAIAEEILQDIFLALWRRREMLNETDDLRAYLYASVRNRAKNYAHHESVVVSAQTSVQQNTIDVPLVGNVGPTPEEIVDADDFFRAYHRTLTTLTERERLALQLRWEEDMTFEEIGQVLDISIVGARAMILRAQKKLQKLLTEFRS